MISYVSGNLFESPAQVLVNTVNTVGVMGRGIAKEFKRIYPEMFEKYRDLCERDQFDIGQLILYKSPNKWVLNFPTKKHWRYPSKPEYIEKGLKKIVLEYKNAGIHSISFPPLGCGNGELDFESQVKPLMEKYLKNLPIYVFIYPGLKTDIIPEHKTPKEIKDWLTSEPESLSFKEVWDDIKTVLSQKNDFKTLTNEKPFQAYYNGNEDDRIRFIRGGQKDFFVSKEDLLGVWQQLRDHGFSTSKIIPNGLEIEIYYILPIFNELSYVRLVNISDTLSGFQTNPQLGIQYIPPPLRQNRNIDLFEFAGIEC
jgi:O-acetyl-ADP-ribose deacetylase (regulator of RNase III)